MDISHLLSLPLVKKIGLYSDYDPVNLHKDVLYITTDTNQMLDYTFKLERTLIKTDIVKSA